MLRENSFWDIEFHDYNKSLGEKINGLYYFHKKKYEALMRAKAAKRGWFKTIWELLPSGGLGKRSENLAEASLANANSIPKAPFGDDGISAIMGPGSPVKSIDNSPKLEFRFRPDYDAESKFLTAKISAQIAEAELKIKRLNSGLQHELASILSSTSKLGSMKDQCLKLRDHTQAAPHTKNNRLAVKEPSLSERAPSAALFSRVTTLGAADNTDFFKDMTCKTAEGKHMQTQRVEELEGHNTPSKRLSSMKMNSFQIEDGTRRWIVLCEGRPILLSSTQVSGTTRKVVSKVRASLQTDAESKHRQNLEVNKETSPPLLDRGEDSEAEQDLKGH